MADAGGITGWRRRGSCHPQHTLQVGQDGGRSVTCMVSAGTGVWVALQSSAQVRLYHATSYEQLAEADITPPVHKMLAGKSHRWADHRITESQNSRGWKGPLWVI